MFISFLLKCHGSLFTGDQLTIMSAVVQIMAWCQTDDTQIPRPMLMQFIINCPLQSVVKICLTSQLQLVYVHSLSQNSPEILALCWFVITRYNLDGSLKWLHNGRDGVSPLFTPLFIQAHIKENIIKAPRHWPLWGEFTGDRWIPRTNGQLRGNVSIWCSHHVPRYSQELLIHISRMCIQNVSCKMAVILSWSWYVIFCSLWY